MSVGSIREYRIEYFTLMGLEESAEAKDAGSIMWKVTKDAIRDTRDRIEELEKIPQVRRHFESIGRGVLTQCQKLDDAIMLAQSLGGASVADLIKEKTQTLSDRESQIGLFFVANNNNDSLDIPAFDVLPLEPEPELLSPMAQE